MTIVCDYDHICRRAEQLEREGAREMRKLAEAKAITGPEHVNGTDGSEILVADGGRDHVALREGETRDDGNTHTGAIIDAQLAEAEKASGQTVLDVGDIVSPVGREAKTTVVCVTGKTAGEYYLDFCDETVAEYQECDPSEDVYEVVFPSRTTKDIDDEKRFAYPRSALEVVHYFHERDDDGDETDDTDDRDEWIENDDGEKVPRRSEPADFGGGESTGVQDL